MIIELKFLLQKEIKNTICLKIISIHEAQLKYNKNGKPIHLSDYYEKKNRTGNKRSDLDSEPANTAKEKIQIFKEDLEDSDQKQQY